METKIKNIFFASGAILAVAAGFAPLATCNAEGLEDETGAKAQGTTVVNVIVDDYISLDAASAGDTIPVTATEVGEGKITATVSSTADYTISLSAANPNLVKSDDSTKVIPAGTNVTAGNSAWGVQKDGETTYTALTPTAVQFYEGTGQSGATPVTTEFKVGVSVDATVPEGLYSTEVTVLAAKK